MAKVALIQSIFRVLNYGSSDRLHGLEQQIWDRFYEALEEEYNHTLYTARTLDEYRTKGHPVPVFQRGEEAEFSLVSDRVTHQTG